MRGKVYRHVALVATKGAEAAPHAHAAASVASVHRCLAAAAVGSGAAGDGGDRLRCCYGAPYSWALA